MEYLANEVAAGCKAGLFTQPPFSAFVRLPMGIVTKNAHSLSSIGSYTICPGLHKILSMIISIWMPSDTSMAPLMRQ